MQHIATVSIRRTTEGISSLLRWSDNFEQFSECLSSSYSELKNLLWSFLKDLVYGESIWTLAELKVTIHSITHHVTAVTEEFHRLTLRGFNTLWTCDWCQWNSIEQTLWLNNTLCFRLVFFPFMPLLLCPSRSKF